MDKESPAEINQDWKDYYIALEFIRQSGVTNMFGASPYLAELCDISMDLASQVLCNWMKNYAELSKLYWPTGKLPFQSESM